MTRIPHQERLTALHSSLLQAASAEGLQSTSSRTCVTCFTALAPHSTFVVRSLCSLIDLCRTHSPSREVNQRGCSLPRTLSLIARVFLSRKTLARRGRAVALRSHKPTAPKARACGLASSKHDIIVCMIMKAQRRLKNKEREGSINAIIHCSYFTHTVTLYTTVYIFLLHLRTNHVCILLWASQPISFASSGIPIWVTFGVFNLTTNLALYLYTESSV
jgi:hypothetical protein